MFSPIGLRYYEQDRAITVFFTPLQRERPWARRLASFLQPLSRQMSLDVELEEAIVWDNTHQQPHTPEAVI